MRRNICIDTDAYKIVHHLQRPGNITKLYSYGEPRVGGKNKKICFFGLQPIIQDNLLAPVTDAIIDEGNVCFTIESTEPWFANMISHYEDFLMHAWYPTSVCTRAMNIKNNIRPYFEKSSDI